jgi:hypothetical protein
MSFISEPTAAVILSLVESTLAAAVAKVDE